MKQSKKAWIALAYPPIFFISLLVLFNIFTSYAHASGAQRPVIAEESDDETTTGTPGQTVPTNPGGGGGSTNPTIPSTAGEPFSSPWSRSDTSIVIDAYEGNSIDWDKMAADKRMVAVIHRSGMGLRADTQYVIRKQIALARGYLWGAYHLGTRGDTIAQANFFLSMVQNEPDTLMILDLENTDAGNFMSISEAVVFMNHVYEKTGRIPTVYANHSTTLLLNQQVKSNPLFQQSKLWYARFKSTISDFPVGIWPNYFLWQFSSEINCTTTGACLYNVPGTKFDMDVNVFNGSARELASRWNND